ncbi:Ypt/Rab-GAP domain of gyp1p superfamily protein isoform 2 [Hibiscus syriacus]|uniref:Ypt/Rab-GAP domain of gyp1p superfamily protein isoform 2 n=1 Tax=Hibiscus syriacus TaxID=106335 RepID=A0A6A3A669_HIBSY|nr:GTPase-activating protein gyp7-like isoform X1 [Hibiscus syriacus]XP_039005201.1 GTPase-activating protein gyp7-like isoform X2 [Hibiscus syriacus]KAE8699850.1 Ypt/Rab-GAP domain of gyp1p superfamily protein isoform 2 [Hibiscus syriacus]
MVSAFFRSAYRKKKKKNEPEKRRNSSRDLSGLGFTIGLPYIAFFMLFLLSDDGIAGFKKWILFAEASTVGGGRGGGGGFWSYYAVVSPSGVAIAVTAIAGIALAASIVYSRRGSLKSPWSHRRRKHVLQPKQWKSLFTEDGKLNDGGVKFLKKVRSGGVDPSIRAEVWPFLLGVYDINSSKEERESVRRRKRKEFESLRKRCHQIHRRIEFENSCKVKETAGNNHNEDSEDLGQVVDSLGLEDVVIARRSYSTEGESPDVDDSDHPLRDQSCQTLQSSDSVLEGDIDRSAITCEDGSNSERESSDSDSSEELENTPLIASEITEENSISEHENDTSAASPIKGRSKPHADEDFSTWQRIIRVDAVRANDEWIAYASSQASVSEIKVQQLTESVGLKEYDHLEPCRIYHAARLVAILEAYTLYDPEIGYCQGMSDLLSPIISVVEDDFLAFWCFAGFMKKARHNFRLDEVGIRRQLNIVSKIIRCKDIHLYKHLEELQAEDCFFVYRMVVVLFRRELNFEQTLCLWEVVWADQAAIRAGITKTGWGRMRLRPPPTDDLLLYAIAACVLQRRKQIIEMYSSMDEIMRECNSMAGQLDVWKLLDDAHDLVVNLHNKI